MKSNTRETLLKQKEEDLAQNIKCYHGNTKKREDYVNMLDSKDGGISKLQKETMLGIVLSDASVDYGASNASTARLKMQQNKNKNSAWLGVIYEVLKEYTVSNKTLNSVSANRPNMVEFDSVSCRSIADFVGSMFRIEKKVKRISNRTLIKRYLGPVAVASWICGDGTKGDHGKNQGKQLEFSTQGFTKTDNDFLVSVLRKRFQINADVQFDYTGADGRDRYRIRVSGPSFDRLLRQIAPYIPAGMSSRVPNGRSPNSRFGTLTDAELKRLLGSKLNNIDALNETYK